MHTYLPLYLACLCVIHCMRARLLPSCPTDTFLTDSGQGSINTYPMSIIFPRMHLSIIHTITHTSSTFIWSAQSSAAKFFNHDLHRGDFIQIHTSPSRWCTALQGGDIVLSFPSACTHPPHHILGSKLEIEMQNEKRER